MAICHLFGETELTMKETERSSNQETPLLMVSPEPLDPVIPEAFMDFAVQKASMCLCLTTATERLQNKIHLYISI